MMLRDFLTELASSANPVPWTAWLPLIAEAQSSESWKDVWGRLSEQAQLRAVQRLRESHSACADALYRLAVANSESLPTYGPARELLLDDAVDAAERNVQRLQSLQWRLEDLGLILEDAQISELDLEAKIAELEGRVAAFRANDIEGRYSKLLALREEEIRLRRMAYELGDVDLTAERNRLSQLSHDITDVQKQKKELHDSIEDKKAELAATRRQTAELGAELTRLVEEGREAGAERDRVRREIERLKDSVGQKKKETEELKERRARAREQLTEAEKIFAELSELSHTPASAEAERLLRSIRTLARELPADEADKKF